MERCSSPPGAALERNGYHILGSIGAEDALKEFQASPGSFGVVITDFSMPSMSGLPLESLDSDALRGNLERGCLDMQRVVGRSVAC